MEQRFMIAGNSKHTGDKRKDNRGYAEPMTSEQVDSLLSEAWLKEMVAEIRSGNEKLKDGLPFLCPHYSAFRNNHRAQADILPEAFTFMTCVDVDDKALVEKAIKKALELNADEYSDWQDQVLRIEYSARKKLHIWLRLPVGKTIEETQREFCQELGVPYDESCITPERFIYLTGKDEEVFRSEHWLEPLSDEEIAERREAYLQRGLDVDGRVLQGAKNTKETIPSVSSTEPATDRTRFIFDACMKECELEPEVLVVEGARHEAVKSILSVGATQLLTKDEFMGVLSERMPQNWQDQNIQQLICDFYAKYHDPSQKMTQFQRKVFAQSRRCNKNKSTEVTAPLVNENVAQSELSRLFAGSVPPEIPVALPKLIKVLTQSTPKIYMGAVTQAVFPALATYPKNLSFRYIDNLPRELRINCLIIAGTGAGKNKSTDMPIAHIIADMKERDEINRERLKKFNEEYNAKAGNKQKPQRPADLVIQTIKSDITKAALVQRMDEAQCAPLFVKLNELEQWDKIEGCSGRNNQFTTLKLCDDEGNDFGTDRAGTQSVTGSGSLHLNWNANSTPSKVIRYFKNVVTDGPISRLCLATIPEREIGADMPVFGEYGVEYDEALKPFIDNLKNATGYIDCPQARKLARKLKDECAEFARLSQDRVFDELTFRALVAVFRKACLLYAANGMKWEKTIEPFCRWSLFYDLYLKMKFWGDQIRHADDDLQTSKRGPRSLLELLPDEFTVKDAKRVRQQQGFDDDDTKCTKMVSQWKTRGYILQLTVDSYKKAEKI